MKLIAWDIEKWKAGAEAYTRNGERVVGLTDNRQYSAQDNTIFTGFVNGQLRTWCENGAYLNEVRYNVHDLMLKVPKLKQRTYYLNIYTDGLGTYIPTSRTQADNGAASDRIACLSLVVEFRESGPVIIGTEQLLSEDRA